jgi:hypothetical protein
MYVREEKEQSPIPDHGPVNNDPVPGNVLRQSSFGLPYIIPQEGIEMGFMAGKLSGERERLITSEADGRGKDNSLDINERFSDDYEY